MGTGVGYKEVGQRENDRRKSWRQASLAAGGWRRKKLKKGATSGAA
jgi:hypothetical protein